MPGSRAELAGILSDKSFESLKNLVCEATLKGIEDMGFTHMTDIQAKTIPHLLEGKNSTMYNFLNFSVTQIYFVNLQVEIWLVMPKLAQEKRWLF